MREVGEALDDGFNQIQTAVSHSTPEAEMIAASVALRVDAIPHMDLWDILLGRKIHLRFVEDNDPMIKICIYP